MSGRKVLFGKSTHTSSFEVDDIRFNEAIDKSSAVQRLERRLQQQEDELKRLWSADEACQAEANRLGEHVRDLEASQNNLSQEFYEKDAENITRQEFHQFKKYCDEKLSEITNKKSLTDNAVFELFKVQKRLIDQRRKEDLEISSRLSTLMNNFLDHSPVGRFDQDDSEESHSFNSASKDHPNQIGQEDSFDSVKKMFKDVHLDKRAPEKPESISTTCNCNHSLFNQTCDCNILNELAGKEKASNSVSIVHANKDTVTDCEAVGFLNIVCKVIDRLKKEACQLSPLVLPIR